MSRVRPEDGILVVGLRNRPKWIDVGHLERMDGFQVGGSMTWGETMENMEWSNRKKSGRVKSVSKKPANDRNTWKSFIKACITYVYVENKD